MAGLHSTRPRETGFLYQTEAELVATLDRLAADVGLRSRVRQAAHSAAERRPVSEVAERRCDFYRDLLGGRNRGAELPAELVRTSHTDGRYLRVLSGEPERILDAALAQPASPVMIAELTGIVARYPGWPVAGRLLGKLWNDLGRPAEAVAALSIHLASRPDSPAGWVEAARTHFGLGDRNSARCSLARAGTANPVHPGAWALVALIGPIDPTAVATAQPDNYTAILGTVPSLAPADRVGFIRGKFSDPTKKFGLQPDGAER